MALTSTPPRVLSADEMDRIQEAAQDLWARVPVRIGRHEEFRAALSDFGCTIDGDRLSFPPVVRETVLGRIEEQRELRGLARPAEVSSQTIRRLASGQAIYRYDHEADAVRPATTADLARFSHVCDLFPELERSHPTFIPQDVPVHSVDVHAFATILKNSSRPWRTAAFGPGSVEYMIEMMLAAGRNIDEIRSDPIINTTCYYTSPFSIGADAIDIAMEARRLLGVPFTIHTMPVMGLSTPATIAGALVQMTAEVLGCNAITLALDNRLARFCVGPVSSDMAAGTHSCSGPDTVLLRIAAAQMGAHLFGGSYAVGLAPMSSAVKPGLQSGLEKGLTAMVGLLAGSRSFGALSLTGTTDVGSEMQLMIDLEMMDWLERLAEGVQIDDERMGVETIAETAPRGARFLAEEHTARFFREELWLPGLIDRRAPMAWLADPASMAERAAQSASRVLADAENRCPLSDEQIRAIDQIVAEADRALA